MASSKDMYLQFVTIEKALHSSDTSTLVEAKIATGLSVRGGLAWLVHSLEWYLQAEHATTHTRVTGALCTVAELTTMPGLGDKGVIGKCESQAKYTTSGGFIIVKPIQQQYLPPIPIAAPNLSLYAETGANRVSLQGELVLCRLGFTTVPLDNSMYAEIAETWGY